MKKTIKLTEIELKSFIKESVNKVLNEIGDTPKGQKKLGALSMRHTLNEPNYDSRNNKLKSYKINKNYGFYILYMKSRLAWSWWIYRIR